MIESAQWADSMKRILFTVCCTLGYIYCIPSLLVLQYTQKQEMYWQGLLWVEKKNFCIWETLNFSTCEHHSIKKQLKCQKHISPVACSLSNDSYYLGVLGKNCFDKSLITVLDFFLYLGLLNVISIFILTLDS